MPEQTNAARAAEILGGPDWLVDWTNDGRASAAEGEAEKQRVLGLITAALDEAEQRAQDETAPLIEAVMAWIDDAMSCSPEDEHDNIDGLLGKVFDEAKALTMKRRRALADKEPQR